MGMSGFGRTLNEVTIMPRYALETILLVLILLWLFGAFISPFGGNLIHLLLVAIVVVVGIRYFTGRRVVD
jgi:hypothetical protein